MKLDINTNALAKHALRLEKMSRGALPFAVRTTLNDTALDVKKITMPMKAKGTFEQRNKTFFTANSKVQFAQGYDINVMKAVVGFYNNSRYNNHAVEELEQQEQGGKISHRSFVPMDEARVGKNKGKNIRANARLKSIKNTVVADRMQGKNDRQKFVRAVFEAGVGGTVLSTWKGRTFLWKINSVKRTKDGRFKMNPLYSFKKGRSVPIKATHFMKNASNESSKKMPNFYATNVKKYLSKYSK